MYQRLSLFYRLGLLLAVTLLVAGCGLFASSATSTPTASSIRNESTRVSALAPSIDQVSAGVLMNMHLHAWNPDAMTRGVVTGGLYINWKMDDPSIRNAVRPGPDGNPQHNHDTQVDLLYLTALAEYSQAHPQDHTFDSDITHMTSVVLADFGNYNVPKGWIYFYLLKNGLLLHNRDLVNEAHNAASNYYTAWYDPTLGFVYDRAHRPGDYSTDHSIYCGAALIDAGQRWNNPNWVSAGIKTIDHVISVGLDPRYHLFYNNMIVNPAGQDSVENYQAKPSTQGQIADALVTAYTLTHRQRYLDVARLVLQSMFNSDLVDSNLGGLFFAIDMKHGKLLGDYKETRSQGLTLIGLHHYDQVMLQVSGQQPFATQEQQMINVITGHFYEKTYHGFFYRLTPDFRIYVSRAHVTGIGTEDYFSTEAMGGTLDALQQAEM